MVSKYPHFANERLERQWRLELIEQQRLDRIVRSMNRNKGSVCVDDKCLLTSGDYQSEWTSDSMPFNKRPNTVASTDIKLTDYVALNYYKGIGFNVYATKAIPKGYVIGYLNGTVMEYTNKMYQSLHHICSFDHHCLKDDTKGLVPLFNVHDGRKYTGLEKDLFVGLLSTKSGSCLKYVNSTCNQQSKNIERWVVPYGNSLNIYYYSTKRIEPGDNLLDDYMQQSANCRCCILGINCVNID